MLKMRKIGILYIFFVLSCFQNKFINEAEIGVKEKPIKKCKFTKTAFLKDVFKAIKDLNKEEFLHLVVANEDKLDSCVLNEEGNTMLAEACRLGFIEVVEYLLAIPKFIKAIDKGDSSGCTPLMFACMLFPYKNAKMKVSPLKKYVLITMLLDKGAKVSLKDSKGCSSLWYADYVCSRSCSIERDWALKVVQLLQKRGAQIQDLEVKENEDKFKLLAFKHKKLQVVNADFALRDAVFVGDLDKVFILLNVFDANPSLVVDQASGNTAMHLACIKFVNSNFASELEIIKHLYKVREIKGRQVWGNLDIENAVGDTPAGIFFSHLINLDSERRRIGDKLDILGKSDEEMYIDHQTKNLSAIRTFLSMLNHEKNIFIMLKTKRIEEEHLIATAAAAAKGTPVCVDPTYLGNILITAGSQFIFMNVTKAELYRFFKRILDEKVAIHIQSANCQLCDKVRKMKILDILIEMAY